MDAELRLWRELPRQLGASRLAPALLPVVYLGLVVVAVFGAAAVIVASAVYAWWLGLIAILVVPPLTLGVIALARIAGELALAVLEMSEHVTGIAAAFPRLASTVDGVASDMPKLGFLRLRSGGKDS